MKKRNYKKYLFISLAFLLVFSIIFGSGIASAEDVIENSSINVNEVEENDDIDNTLSSAQNEGDINSISEDTEVDWSTKETTVGDFVIIGGTTRCRLFICE